jgi:hypothetical protein
MGESNLMINGFPAMPAGISRNARGQMPGGRVRWVCNRSGMTAGDGKSANRPYATIEEAVTDLASNLNSQGDAIYVLPGHAENVDEADWLSELSTLKGLSICGLGTGTQRPSLTWTIATSTLLLDTNDLELANFQCFLAGPHSAGSALTVAAPITVSGTGCRIVDCFMYWGFDVDQIVGDGIIWTGDDGAFIGNECLALVAAVPSNTFLTLTGADRMLIKENWIAGATDATTRGVIDSETTACTNLKLYGNTLKNLLASSTIAVSLTASDTGEAVSNRLYVDTGILPFTAGELEWYLNYVVNDEGEAGALVGTASA